MDRLPWELFQDILLVFAHNATKNDVLTKRLVCRDFNHILRPLGCRTISLELTRLSKLYNVPKPRSDGLQTIGHRCKALHIDMTVLRDDDEVEVLNSELQHLPSMQGFCHALRHRYSFSDAGFTELDFYQTTAEVLFYCRDIDRVRICLPQSIRGSHCGVATRVLANAFKALGQRPEEDSAPLKTLVIDNIPEVTLCELWINPSDVMNMQALLPSVETLALSTRCFDRVSFSAIMFGVALWNMISSTRNLQSLYLACSGASRTVKDDNLPEEVTHQDMDFTQWLERRLSGPGPQVTLPKPTYLELRHVAMLPEELLHIAAAFGPSLEELHLFDVSLMIEQSLTSNAESDMHLWVGLPNVDAGPRQWMAMRFRALMPNLRICRCSNLNYKSYLHTTGPVQRVFDYADPARIGRSIAQRFVEVVTGLQQPSLPDGTPMRFHPHDDEFDHLLHNLTERRSRIPIAEYDFEAHRLAAADRPPDYQHSLDGLFANCVDGSRREIRGIVDKVVEGLMAIERLDLESLHLGNTGPGQGLPDPAAGST
ncbi:hypothetical protein ISF_04295 [Cordyceps fumosorosea ARSEF 2679]|uniref:Uncharacterized protein n=1 Tax=Cordyceps fumosorosea (strain ARSEF 2679) TaxID=1081104 RepID=A0A167XEN9_CORFA|nr:hypothetical protein ISF_04295 [Cordyceps fumosorosea ARSEF 2679]OAA64885.1 hypothetical protein ISF_04295 [Cordyceps fumosorosea ARSEF 2679]